MQKIFEKLKGQQLSYPQYTGVVCGYSSNMLILATMDKPECAFKKVNKDSYVEDYYRGEDFRYVYADERNFNYGKKGV